MLDPPGSATSRSKTTRSPSPIQMKAPSMLDSFLEDQPTDSAIQSPKVRKSSVVSLDWMENLADDNQSMASNQPVFEPVDEVIPEWPVPRMEQEYATQDIDIGEGQEYFIPRIMDDSDVAEDVEDKSEEPVQYFKKERTSTPILRQETFIVRPKTTPDPVYEIPHGIGNPSGSIRRTFQIMTAMDPANHRATDAWS